MVTQLDSLEDAHLNSQQPSKDAPAKPTATLQFNRGKWIPTPLTATGVQQWVEHYNLYLLFVQNVIHKNKLLFSQIINVNVTDVLTKLAVHHWVNLDKR